MSEANDKPKKMTEKQYQAALGAMPCEERAQFFAAATPVMRKISSCEYDARDAQRWLQLIVDADEGCSGLGKPDLSIRAQEIIGKVQRLLSRIERKAAKFQRLERRRALKNWTLDLDPKRASNRDRIQRQIIDLMLSIPSRCADDAHMVYINIKIAERSGKEQDKTDIMELLETEPVSYVYAFGMLAGKGKVQLTPKSNSVDTATH